GIVIVGAQALSSRGATTRATRRPVSAAPFIRPRASAPAPLVGPPAPLDRPPDGAPEMPSLLVGPPAPEPAGPGGVRLASGPGYRGMPLPPVVGLGAIQLPPAGPAVPLAIVPRGPGSAPGGPLLPGEAAPPRPQRSADTSDERPLSVRVSLNEAENSLHGPGAWLKVRASASAPCYVAIFHVDGERHVRIL